jgi:hypothetical protein
MFNIELYSHQLMREEISRTNMGDFVILSVGNSKVKAKVKVVPVL